MKRILKWTGIVLGSVLGILVIALVVLSQMGASKVSEAAHTVNPPPATLMFVADSATVARGAHLTAVLACKECHGANFGGQVIIDAPPFKVVAPNLTSGAGGVGGQYEPGDWERAIRQGITPTGRGLLAMMPSRAYHNVSDEDIQALVAYLEQVEAVDHELPPTELRLLGKVIAATNPITGPELISTGAAAPATTPRGDPMALGEYWAKAICQECHGDNLRGAPNLAGPDNPYATDLVIVSSYSLADFTRTLREGVKLNGQQIDNEFMPWQSFRHFTDEDLAALHTYLQTVGSDAATTAGR